MKKLVRDALHHLVQRGPITLREVAEPTAQSPIELTQQNRARPRAKPDDGRRDALPARPRLEVGNLVARWYPRASYAPYVEFGTGPHEIKAVNKKVLANTATGQIFGPIVHHPGTKANPFMERIVAGAQPDIETLFVQALNQVNEALASQANG